MLTNSKTKTEIELDNKKANEYEKALNQLLSRRDLIGYETIFANMPQAIKLGFQKYLNSNKISNFESFDDQDKKSELRKYLEQNLEKSKSRVHKNSFLASGMEKLF